jgi:hypothetical protein
MLSDLLIRIIESHAEELTRGAVRKLQSSPRTRSYHGLPHDALYQRVSAVYHDLGGWLGEKTDPRFELGITSSERSVSKRAFLWATSFGV